MRATFANASEPLSGRLRLREVLPGVKKLWRAPDLTEVNLPEVTETRLDDMASVELLVDEEF